MTEGPETDDTGEDDAQEAADDGADRDADRQESTDAERDRQSGDSDAREATNEDAARVTDEDGTRSTEEDVDEATNEDGDRQVAAATGSGETVPVDTGADDGRAGESDVRSEETAAEGTPDEETPASPSLAGDEPTEDTPNQDEAAQSDVPDDVRKYDKFKKIDGGTYDRANEFLRDRTYITAREWAIARLCADFRTETGVEMTKIGENLPELVPFMTDTYTPQAVNQARSSFEGKVRKSGATFLYGAMCDFFTAQELDDVMYEATEVAKFLLEVEGVELSVDEELEAEDRISEVMREVREHSAALRHDEMTCPECGHEMNVDE